MAKVTNLTNLDFDTIRDELKSFLQNQSEFTDYDFDGSGMSVFLDILSYNTHMNAMMSHLIMNESFLDTAQKRANVVASSQLIGYVPRSRAASKVGLNITIQGDEFGPGTAALKRGHKFTGVINNKQYTFMPNTNYSTPKLNDNTYIFKDVIAYEGTLKTLRYNVDGADPNQKFEIVDKNVDLNTLTVQVFDNQDADIATSYHRLEEIGDSGTTAEVFFLKENQNGYYDIFFGDGYLGKKPLNNSLVEIKYITSSGPEANNIKGFSSAETIEGYSDITVTFADTYTASRDGLEREDIESIRFNAPIQFSTQNRAVTSNDYRSLILSKFNEYSDVSVWGGEEANPPTYGKVFIAPVLTSGKPITQLMKDALKSYLKKKNIGVIIPEIVDIEYTNIQLYCGIKFDTNKTVKSEGELKQIALDTINVYNSKVLANFNSVYRQSNLLTLLDRADEGIISSVLRVNLYKTFTPDPTKKQNYEIDFPTKIHIDRLANDNVTTDEFFIGSTQVKLGDEAHPTDITKRRLYFYKTADGFTLPGYSNVGYVDFDNGEVVIENVQFSLTNDITVYVKPATYDIAPKYNQLLQINSKDITIDMSYDTVSANGSAGLSSYEPFER